MSDLEATFAAPDSYAKPRAEIFDLETQLKTARLTSDFRIPTAAINALDDRHLRASDLMLRLPTLFLR